MVDDAQALAQRHWPVLLLGSGGLLLVLFVALAGTVVMVPVVAAAFGAAAGICPTPTPTSTTTAAAVTATPGPSTPTPTSGPWDSCVNADANAIVYWAMQAAPHLHDCGSQNLDECYDTLFPEPLIDWWLKTCPGCSQWRNGNLQCVMLAGAIFGVAGLPLDWGPNGNANGIDFWYEYGSHLGWVEIPSSFEPGSLLPAPANARGLPAPGDLIAWYDLHAPTVGHLAVVVRVVPPSNGQLGSVTFVEANGPGALVSEPINPDLTVDTWPGYFVAGYIRAINVPLVATATPAGG